MNDTQEIQTAAKPFRILAIDGGGYRGVYAAHILKRLEETFKIKCVEQFDLFAGTSTGAIIAAGLCTNFSAAKIAGLYKEKGDVIFGRKRRLLPGLLKSKFDCAGLRKVLSDFFSTKTLGEVKRPLIVPATDIGNGCVHVFKSAYHGDFVRDTNVPIADAVLASCSAPTYFDPFFLPQHGSYLLADGGLWANNPALVAAIDAHKRLNIPLENINVLSIGTGVSKQFYAPFQNTRRHWGFLNAWKPSKFIAMLLNLQSASAGNMLKLLLKDAQILRLNFESDHELPLDSTYRYHDWISRADDDFSKNASRIKSFISTPTQEDKK